MDHTFLKILAAAKRLGVPAITVIADEPVVVMPIEAYEQLVKMPVGMASATIKSEMTEDSLRDLTEEDLFDRINRDIAVWRSAHQEGESVKPTTPEPVIEPITAGQRSVETAVSREEDDQFYIEPVA